MAQQTINIGTAANDGTGDPIRDAFDKVNDNFNEMYSAYIANTSVTVGNTTVNTVISNTGLASSNSTVTAVANLTNFRVGNTTANAQLTGTAFAINGSATLGSASINTSALGLGNSTVNTIHNVTTLSITNSTSNVTVGAGSLLIGNSTVNTTVNSSIIKVGSANVTTNTLSLGSSTDAANGFTYLPNGFKMNWGWASVNATVGNAIFTAAYTTNAYVVVATGNSSVGSYEVSVLSKNNSTVEIRTANAASINVNWTAIGK